jgi:hypothetical protein
MSTEGDSGSEFSRRLGMREGCRVLLLEPPANFQRKMEPLPDGAVFAARGAAAGEADLVLLFAPSHAVLLELFRQGARAMAPRGRLWALWPRLESGFFTDVTEERVRAVGLSHALVDDKLLAVDSLWGGLRFLHKERDRIKIPPSKDSWAPPA